MERSSDGRGAWVGVVIAVAVAGCGAADAPAPTTGAADLNAERAAEPAAPTVGATEARSAPAAVRDEAERTASPPAPTVGATEARSAAAREEAEWAREQAEWAREEAERARRAAEQLEAFREAVGPIAPELAARAEQFDGEYGTYDLRTRGRFLVVTFDESGNGIVGGWASETHVLSSSGPVLELSMSGMDGDYVSAVAVAPDPRSTTELDALRAAVGPAALLLESARSSDAGRAQLFLSVRERPRATRADGVTIVGPLYRSARVVSGPPPSCAGGEPRALPALYVRPSVLGVAGRGLPARTEEEEEEEEEQEPLEADEGDVPRGELVWIAAVEGCPQVTAHAGVEVHAYAMYGRNRGALIALYDPRRDRHRWILETRYAVLGSDVRWLGARGGVLFGAYRSSHPGALYAGHAGIVGVRVRDGAVFRIDVDGAFQGDERVGALDEEAELDRRASACEAELSRASGTEELPPEAFARCRARADDAEVRSSTLHVRRADGGRIELPLDDLASRIRQIR